MISFLNAIIYQEQPVIQDLEILNPYVAPKIRGIKDSYLDIKAKIIDDDHKIRSVIIEMQVLNVEGFEKRILYNAAKSYSTQLTTGQSYSELTPVIALTITDFIMFPDIDKVLSRFVLKEKDYLIDYPDELEDQEKSEIFIHDQRGAIVKGFQQGLQQGLQQGIEQGLQQGIEQGIEQNTMEIAKKMLNLVDDQVICQITGLSLTEISALKIKSLG